MRAQGERERQVREVRAEEARRKREEETELVSDSRSPLVTFKGGYCENETTYVPKGHMAGWRNARWIRVDNGPHLQTARGRRRVWRATRRAAEQARGDDRVEETQSPAEETEGEKWRRKKWEQVRRKQHPARCLPLRKHVRATVMWIRLRR